MPTETGRLVRERTWEKYLFPCCDVKLKKQRIILFENKRKEICVLPRKLNANTSKKKFFLDFLLVVLKIYKTISEERLTFY